LCQRDRRADIASLCHPVHKPTANTRSTMVAAANRFLSKLFLLSKSNLGRHLFQSGTIRKTHVTMASAATATWLANEFILEKTAWDNVSFQGVGIVGKSDANRKPSGYLRSPCDQNDSGAIWSLVRACQENCITLHDAEARPNVHFLSSPVQSEPKPKKT